MDAERPLSNLGARIIGQNGPPDDRFWYRSGLSLLVASPHAPPDFLEEHERDCIPGSEIGTGDVVVFFRGDQLSIKPSGERMVIDTSKLDLLRVGVAYSDATDQVRVLSQDEHGNVWNHSIDQLPGYNRDDWDYYGLRLVNEPSVFRYSNEAKPLEAIDAWLNPR